MTAWRWAAIPMSGLLLGAGFVSRTPTPPSGPRPACAAVGSALQSVPSTAAAAPRVSPLRLATLPLRTSGNRILDRRHREVTLARINWYGAEEQDYIVGGLDRRPLDAIAREVRALGFNSVRLPWSNALLHDNPVVCDLSVAANPQLRGKHALAVLDAVVSALGAQGIMVISTTT